MARKRGKLSKKEEQFILQFKDTISLAEIAKKVNRTEETVSRFLSDKALTTHAGMSLEESTEGSLRIKLKKKPYWQEVEAQFMKEGGELEYFIQMWIKLMLQFKEDVLVTEELEIKQWLTLDILMNRSMKERKKSIKEIEDYEKILRDEYDKPAHERDAEKVLFASEQLSYARSIVVNYTTEHTKLQTQIKDIRNALRAARSDRIKQVEDGKTSWVGLIRSLEDTETREKAGEEAEILTRAVDKARTKFSEYHEYIDGKIDQPFLNADTVKEQDDE
jgi:hypothetical protein